MAGIGILFSSINKQEPGDSHHRSSQDSKMYILTMIVLLLILFHMAGGDNKVSHTGVRGDQTVGGVHLFEIHSPSGGMGLSLKMLILLAVALGIAYWCLLQRAKKMAMTAAL